MVIVLLASLALIGIAVTLVVRAGTAPRARRTESLSQISHYGFSSAGRKAARESTPVRRAIDAMAAGFGEWYSRNFGPSENRERELRNLLIGAGYFTLSPRKFTGYRVLATVFATAFWIWLIATGAVSLGLAVIGLVIVPVCGWLGPLWIVKAKAERRLAKIDYELPELIDLLVVTVEAGVGFSASLQIAVGRLPGPLGEELRLVLQEQAMGLSTNEALRNLLARCDTPAVRSFVRSILQGETLGVSIGQIMRNLATEMRKRRRAAAEERAQKAPIKMLFPLVLLIFPAMFVILLGPAIYSFTQAFGD